MDREMNIQGMQIGPGHPCFVIAEAGVNHNGQLEKALELVTIAKQAGADAVKFQLYNIEEQISRHTLNAPYQRKGSGEKTMIEMARTYELPWEEHKIIAEHSKNIGIIYMSSCFDYRAVDFFIKELNGDCIKVGSGELTNYPLLSYISKTGLLILLSTGMCTLEDVKGAVEHIKSNGTSPIVLLHCVSNYPAKVKDINIRAMITLQKKFNVPVGYSDHTNGNSAAIAATALGANVIEKHFTIDRNLPGPDHSMSLNPNELKIFINKIRRTESLIGDGIKKPTDKEIEMQIFSRRSAVAKCDIKKGELLSVDNLTLKRPALGIDPRELESIIGKKVNQLIPFDTIITTKMIEMK
jgi:N,N'-diacetyllegionaminate synthase